MVSIKDVAREAGVSTATVSRVVNRQPKTSEAAIEAVNLAIKKLGYRVSTNKQSRQVIGAVVSDIAEPFFGEILKGVETVARKNNKQMLVYSSDYNAKAEQAAIEQVIRHCDFAVVHSKWLKDAELIDYARQLPGMVLINRYIKCISHCCIALDNCHGGYIATQFLLNKGHRYIGYLCSDQNIDDSINRLKGHKNALREAAVPFDDHYLVSCHPTNEGGRQGACNLLAKKLPLTAIVTYNDVMSAGVLSALAENGLKCPDDISVVGFDDLAIARYLTPSLSTVRYPVAVMAEQAARLALGFGEKNDKKQVKTLIPAFVERNSTQAASMIA